MDGHHFSAYGDQGARVLVVEYMRSDSAKLARNVHPKAPKRIVGHETGVEIGVTVLPASLRVPVREKGERKEGSSRLTRSSASNCCARFWM